MTAENNALMREAEWLETALANSANKGYNVEFRKGFAAAVGWVRLHAENPDEIGLLHPHADDCAFLVSVELHCTCGAAVEKNTPWPWMLTDREWVEVRNAAFQWVKQVAEEGRPGPEPLKGLVERLIRTRVIPPEGKQP